MKQKSKSPTAFFTLRVLLALLVCGAGCLVFTGTLLGVRQVPANSSARTLTFAERVAYQRAIEDVYWRHRIWPEENRHPKPALDAVMSQEQIENKVADYLRKSQALEDYCHRPITADELQAEMNRMAEHTKQPAVLRELFEALGNDPFVIAECLARSILAERLLAHKTDPPLQENRRAYGDSAAGTPTYVLPRIADWAGCTDDNWTPTSSANAPDGREFHTAVWTGTEMIVWGGYNGSALNTGGIYTPSTDSWTATSTTNAPAARSGHTAVWTGSEMIVWGGNDGPTYFNTGGKYNPATDSWTATSTTNAPEARASHTAVWTGTEMIIWGGVFFNTGGRYNPNTDAWGATSTTNAPTARYVHTAVWTGSEMIVWGGYDGSNDVNTGGLYNPITDSWTATTTSNAPMGRELHTGVWTGNQMMVWGGYSVASHSSLNTGGTYNPNTDTWTTTNSTNAPSARYYHTAVWTGSETIIWGGTSGVDYLNTGGRYNPGTDSWTVTSTTNAPDGRYAHTAEWTSTEMIVWGGVGSLNYLNTGGRYCAQSGATPTPTATATATATSTPTATATSTPTSSATPRVTPTPRIRPTPQSRPTPPPHVTPVPPPASATPTQHPRP